MKYYPPQYRKDSFHCPRCSVFASQDWYIAVYRAKSGLGLETELEVSLCAHCNQQSYWREEQLLFPSVSVVEMPSDDLPKSCLPDYLEARDVVGRSPRGAAALLRLCIQKLLDHLGFSGRNINDDIKALVKQGLPVIVQQSLDICRVVGNNAVHPGEMDLKDTPEIAHTLFRLVNVIVEDRITRPKEIQALYDALPTGALDAIEKRDKPQE